MSDRGKELSEFLKTSATSVATTYFPEDDKRIPCNCAEHEAKLNLGLWRCSNCGRPVLPPEPVRTFTSGATRSPLGDKLEYHKFLDPRVLKRWCEYLQKHRVQTDGNVREPNNWKKGIPIEAYVGSLMRHMMDVWFWNDNHQAEMTEEIEDSLCAILFNAHGLLFELLKDRR